MCRLPDFAAKVITEQIHPAAPMCLFSTLYETRSRSKANTAGSKAETAFRLRPEATGQICTWGAGFSRPDAGRSESPLVAF